MTGIDTPAAAPDQGSHRALRLAVGAAAVVVLLLGLSQLSRIVGPFFLALNLMVVVWPVQRYLAGRIPRVLAAILSGLLSIIIIGLLFWAIGWAASLFVAEIPQYKPQFQSMYDTTLNLAGQFGITSTQILDQLKSINPSSVVSVVGSLISNVGSALSLFVVVVTVLLFMVVDSVDFETRLERLGKRHNPVFVLALQSFAGGVRKYWVTSTVFGLIVSTLTWVGLAAYGIPLAIVWAVLAFVTNYIPNIGFVIGLVPAAVMGLLAKGPWGALFVIVLYGVLNFVIQGVVQPKVAGEAVGVTSTVSFLSLLVWAVVLGPLGALLALPATLFVKALVVDADPRARWVNALIASNPRTSSEEPVLVSDDGVSVEAPVQQAAPVDPNGEQAAPLEAFSEQEPAGDDTSQVVTTQDTVVIEEQPRRSLFDDPEAKDGVDVVPRHSADPENADPVTVVGAEDVSDIDTSGMADLEEREAVDQVPETEPVDTEPIDAAAPEDVPRHARAEADARLVDELDLPDDYPVFQKSATPFWTGVTTHAED